MTAPTDNAARRRVMGEPTETLRAARHTWLRDLLLYGIQFTMYADATPEEVQEVIDGLSESDEYDPNVAALVQIPKWCSPCEAQEAVDRYFAAAIPPEQDGYAEGRVLVPAEPTPAMIEAGERAGWDHWNSMPAIKAIPAAWSAMLAAAPAATSPTDRHAEGRIAGLEEAAKIIHELAEAEDELLGYLALEAAEDAIRSTIANGETA
jgi:hypothetical protein